MTDAAAFRDDVLGEPATLAALATSYAAADGPLTRLDPHTLAGRRVLVTGLGSSRFAALPVVQQLRVAGVAAVAERSSATGWAPSSDLILVAVSASGATTETVASARRHAGQSLIIAVTNDERSPLAEAADVVLPLLAGVEQGGVACRTYQCSLAVLLLLADRLRGRHARPTLERLRRAADAAAALVARRDRWLGPLVELCRDAEPIAVIAPSARISSAEQAALMLREGPRLVAAAAEAGDWLHVDLYLTVHRRHVAIVFGGSGYEAAIAGWIERRGTRLALIGAGMPLAAVTVDGAALRDADLALLLETTVVELLAAELWLAGVGPRPAD